MNDNKIYLEYKKKCKWLLFFFFFIRFDISSSFVSAECLFEKEEVSINYKEEPARIQG